MGVVDEESFCQSEEGIHALRGLRGLREVPPNRELSSKDVGTSTNGNVPPVDVGTDDVGTDCASYSSRKPSRASQRPRFFSLPDFFSSSV